MAATAEANTAAPTMRSMGRFARIFTRAFAQLAAVFGCVQASAFVHWQLNFNNGVAGRGLKAV